MQMLRLSLSAAACLMGLGLMTVEVRAAEPTQPVDTAGRYGIQCNAHPASAHASGRYGILCDLKPADAKPNVAGKYGILCDAKPPAKPLTVKPTDGRYGIFCNDHGADKPAPVATKPAGVVDPAPK